MTDYSRGNQQLLVGMIAGALSTFDERLGPVTLEADDHGVYTGRILIERGSGTWVLTVEPYTDD